MSDYLVKIILPLSLGLGVVAGFVMHRSDFCFAGMFRDLFLFRNAFMLRNLVVVLVLLMGLYECARLAGLTIYPFPGFGPASAGFLLGGALFGIGMVLAGGCVVGTLYRMGSGRLLSGVAFAGLIVGSTLYAEIHPWWKAVEQALQLPTEAVTLPQLLSVSPTVLIVPLVCGGALLLWRWARQGKLQRSSSAAGYLQPWKAGAVLALLGLMSVLVIGLPLGITTCYAKAGGMLLGQWVPEHIAALGFFNGNGLNFTHPLAGVTLRGGAGPHVDAIALIQFPLVGGIVLGAAFSALLLREWRLTLSLPPRQLIAALAGGLVMGVAARMASGCNIWYLLGGIPLLTLDSLLFVTGLFPGAWAGSRLLDRWVV